MPANANILKIVEEAEEVQEVAPPYSDEYLAVRFADRHAHEARHVAINNKWLHYGGDKWHVDKTRLTYTWARNFVREEAYQMVGDHKAKGVASERTRAAIVSLAREDSRIAATAEQWDADPWLLNTPNGVVDLRTGDMRSHSPVDYMTKIASVSPDPQMAIPQWREFLKTITAGDEELQLFLQRLSGYCLTGSTREHALFFLFGQGANGKSVFINTITSIVSEYHRTAPMETFTASKFDRHPTELAGLHGARLVTAIETEEGRRWNESKLKTMTGGDKMTARFMRGDFFDFEPQFKLIIAGNHKPGLRAVDEAIRRRIHLVPFSVTIPSEERDPDLGTKLQLEWPGILAWMIEGALSWQSVGLSPPAAVTEATNEYLEGEDAINSWVIENCVRSNDAWTKTGVLYSNWQDWAHKAGEYPLGSKRFSQQLEAHGFKPHRRDDRGFLGIAIKF